MLTVLLCTTKLQEAANSVKHLIYSHLDVIIGKELFRHDLVIFLMQFCQSEKII